MFGYDVLGVMRERSPIKRNLLEKLPDVKLLATAGMRNAAIDLDYCRERGIAVCGTQNSAQATPELAWGMMLTLARKSCASWVMALSGRASPVTAANARSESKRPKENGSSGDTPSVVMTKSVGTHSATSRGRSFNIPGVRRRPSWWR